MMLCMQVRKLWHILSHVKLHSSVCLYVSPLWSYFFEISHPTHGCKEDGGGWARDGKKYLEACREGWTALLPFS